MYCYTKPKFKFIKMEIFNPDTIKHLQIDSINELSLPFGNTYLVFWWKKIPLAHLWFREEKNSLSASDFRNCIIEAITPVLGYYFTKYGVRENWKSYLQKNDIGSVARLLQNCFSENQHDVAKDLSVVICTRNRPLELEQCIRSLMNSADRQFELIVVDNAPDDNSTKEVVEKFSSVRYVLEERKGLDIARNTGAYSASHSIIAYTDDDVFVDKDWTKNLKLSFQDPMTMAVTGLVFPFELRTKS